MENSAPFFDEMLGPDNGARPPYEAYHRWFKGEDRRDLIRKSGEAERFFRRKGITFKVYGAAHAILSDWRDEIWPPHFGACL
jgi:uncharacterized circularly permuted ATP-grasp superfamily protein